MPTFCRTSLRDPGGLIFVDTYSQRTMLFRIITLLDVDVSATNILLVRIASVTLLTVHYSWTIALGLESGV